MESNNRIKNIINIFVPLIIAMLLQVVVVVVDIAAIFIKNMLSDEKTAASRSIEAIMSQDYTQPMNTAAISAFQFILYILIFGIWFYKMKKPSLTEGFFGIIKPPVIIFLLTGGIASQFLVDGVLAILRPIFESAFAAYDELLSGVTGASRSWLMLLSVFLLAPVAEEILFRGLILTYAKRCMPTKLAIALQALLFGVYHGNIIQGTYAFLLGLLLGGIAAKTDNLIAAIVFHIAINLSILAVPIGFFDKTTSTILTTAISAVILTICMYFILFKNKHNQEI
ncbi:MAG: CPBP family intramembrane metalloprotease [Lachnospiraceae bacterium]|nr:CPBP family intramembrane metalloprotease [Lachnospiraceae bacterium]